MLRAALLVFGLSLCCADMRVSNANLFMDTLLLGRMPREAPFEGIEPYKLEPIFIRVNIKNTFGHKFKVNFTSNSVTGLSKVKRLDDCSRAAIRNGNITIKCNVHFKEVEINLDGFGEGDTTIKRSHRVQARASFDKTYALIEIAGPERDRPGSLMSDRLAEFKMNLNNELSIRLKSMLEGKYRTVLEKAVSTVNLPPV